MRIAIAQLNTRAGDFDPTAERMEAFVQNAADDHADLVVFPLTVLTGPTSVDYASHEGYRADLLRVLESLNGRLACPCLVPVVTDMLGESVVEVMLLGKGGVTPLRTRSLLSQDQREHEQNDMGLLESELRESAHAPLSFEFEDWRMVVASNYDELNEVVDSTEQYDVVLFVSSYGYALDDTSSALGASLQENRYKADAVSMDAWLVGVSGVGGYGLQVFTGSSFVLAPNGDLIASAPAFEEALVMADLTVRGGKGAAGLEAQGVEPELYNRSLHLWETLVLGLRDYLQKQGHQEVALALDGGLASCLLGVLASDALGPTHVHALVDASRESARVQTARKLAEDLRVDVHELSDSFKVADDPNVQRDMLQVALARMAREQDAVVLSAADKTFLAVEATRVCCDVADLLPFGDVYRCDLVDLAHLRNTISPIVPAQAFGCYDVPRIEGLEEAETTNELRLERVDVTLSAHVEWERSLSDVAARQGAPELTAAILRTLRDTQPARDTWAPCLVASSRPLFAARMPQGFAWHDRVRSEEERTEDRRRAERIVSTLRDSDARGQTGGDVPDFSHLLEGLEVELKSGPLSEGVDRETLESALGDLLGLIQDMAQSGEQPPNIGGPFGPLTWGSPFSEN
jgi:NAD+ synthase (glutamine-hydrolysing)